MKSTFITKLSSIPTYVKKCTKMLSIFDEQQRFFFRFCLSKWQVSSHSFHEKKPRRMRHDVKHIVLRQLNTNEYVAI